MYVGGMHSRSMAICGSCGSALNAGSFCANCGSPTPTEVTDRPPSFDARADTSNRERLQRTLGHEFVLGELLGRGGFGEVYSAFDTGLKREVAIKILRAEHAASPDFLSRFRREAEAVAQLRHPNIVPIYTVGDRDGVAFFVMPRINGISLAERLAGGRRLSEREACRILVETAGALEAAHRASVIHRDVKPENILLEGEEQRALLMDFGIAARTDGSGSPLTRTGSIVGTPTYMSPEQATGDRVDARSDIYSLGVLAYQMLSGQLPFAGDNAHEIVFGHLTRAPENLAVTAEGVTPAVASVVMRCLAKWPAQRFESARAFANALEEAAATGATSGSRSPRIPRVAAPSRREWALIALAGAAGIVWAVSTLARGANRRVDDPGISRADALRAANNFFTLQGAVGNFAETVVLSTDDRAADFVTARLGRRAGASWIGPHVAVGYWRVTWIARDSSATWTADIGPRGRVVGFDLPVSGSLWLSEADAAGAARRALAERGLDTAGLVLDNQSSVNRSKGVEHSFVWRHRFPELERPVDGTFQVHGDFSATVKGGRVTDLHAHLHLPRQTTPPVRTALYFTFLLGLVAAMASGALRLLRGGSASLAGSAGTGASVGLATLLLFALRWDLIATSGWPTGVLVIVAPVFFLLVAALASLMFLGADGALDGTYDELRVDWSLLRLRGLRTADAMRTILTGLALGLGLAAIEALNPAATNSLGSSAMIVSALVPLLFVLGFAVVVTPMFVMPLAFVFGTAGRLTRSKWAATCVVFLAAAAVGLPSGSLSSQAALVALAFSACVALTLGRFGTLCSLIQLGVTGVFETAAEMTASSEPSVQLSGDVLLALLAALALGAAIRLFLVSRESPSAHPAPTALSRAS